MKSELVREFFELASRPELDEERANTVCYALHIGLGELAEHHERARRLRELESRQREFETRETLNDKRAEMISVFFEERSKLVDALTRQITRLTADHRAEQQEIADFHKSLDEARHSVLVHPAANLTRELVEGLAKRLLGTKYLQER